MAEKKIRRTPTEPQREKGELDLPKCSKCGGPVPPENDAQRLQLLVDQIQTGDYSEVAYAVALFAENTHHLYPIKADPSRGIEGCEGSPSRVKMIKNRERNWVTAFNRLQGL